MLADFVAALDPVNAAADNAPGFVWRLQTEDGNTTAVQAFAWDVADSAGVIVNLSVWVDIDHLAASVYGELHRQVLRQRRRWFASMQEAFTACWWVPAGARPSTDEAERRIRHLRVMDRRRTPSRCVSISRHPTISAQQQRKPAQTIGSVRPETLGRPVSLPSPRRCWQGSPPSPLPAAEVECEHRGRRDDIHRADVHRHVGGGGAPDAGGPTRRPIRRLPP